MSRGYYGGNHPFIGGSLLMGAIGLLFLFGGAFAAALFFFVMCGIFLWMDN